MQIQGQSQNTEKLSGLKTDRLLLTFRLYANAANTLCTLPNFQTMVVKATLNRRGVNHEIFNDNVQNLGVASQFHKGLEPMVNINYALPRVGSPAAAGVVSSVILPVVIHLPGTVDVSSADSLTLEMNVNQGYSAAGSTLNIAASNVDTYWLPSDGHEQAIPVIRCQYLQSSTGTANLSCGDHVKTVIIANYDKGLGSILTPGTLFPINGSAVVNSDANQVISNLNFSTTHFSQTLSGDRLNMQTLAHFENPQDAVFRGQCYLFSHHKDAGLMDNVQMSFTMNAGNLTASNNVVTSFGFILDGHTMERYHASVNNRSMHHAQKMAKYGIAPHHMPGRRPQ